MAKKNTKSTVKASAKAPTKGASKAPVKSSKPAPKPVAKVTAKVSAKVSAKVTPKVSLPKKDLAVKAKELKPSFAKPVAKAPGEKAPLAKATGAKATIKSDKPEKAETPRPALMTARGKVKSEETAVPVAASKNTEKYSEKIKPAAEPKDGTEKEFDNNGDQLIAMAKDEMSKINRTGEHDKSAEKTSKFKPIKIERGNLTDEKAKWQELNKRYGKEKAVTYKMSESFESLKPIQHKVLGWGFILTNDNNRLEVLFENGIKMLISNYKAN